MSDRIIYINGEDFDKEIKESELPAVVAFYSEDCAPCSSLTNIFKRMAETYGEHMKFVMIHRQQNRQLAEALKVKSSPTIIFFRNGEEVCSRLNGYIDSIELKRGIENVSGGRCRGKARQRVHCDVLILGGGPAGLSAAIYAARAKLFTVVLDESLAGGQVSTTFHVANYPGTNGVVRGIDLMENMKKQALDFGAQLDELKEVLEINIAGEEKYVKAEDTDYYAKSIILATGSTPRRLPAEGESQFRGRGVHYCATCDGAFYQDANVFVIGGGNSAVEEAVFLTRYAKHVTIMVRGDRFQAPKAIVDEALANPNISVIWNCEVRKINGDSFVKSVLVEDLKTKEMKELETDGLFVYIGMEPKTSLLKGQIKLNDNGYIITDEDMKTLVPGVYAAGDVRAKTVRQIATAVSDGVIAGIMVEKFINKRYNK